MKSDGEIMEILPAYDLTGSVRSAAVLVGCSHNTVAAHVPARDAGRAVGTPARSNSGTPRSDRPSRHRFRTISSGDFPHSPGERDAGSVWASGEVTERQNMIQGTIHEGELVAVT